MKILSLRFENLSPFSGSYSINFDSADFSQSKTFSILEKQGGSGKIILDAISLSLFGKTFFEEGKTSEISLSSDKTGPAAAEVTFTCSGVKYNASWKAVPTAAGHSIYRELRNENNELVDDNLQTVSNSVSSLLELTPEAFNKLVFLDLRNFSPLLGGDHAARESALSKVFGQFGLDNLPVLTKEVAKQKRIAADVSRRMLNAFEILPPEKENQLTSQLANLKQSIMALKSSINDNAQAISWLQKLDSLKEELQRLLKEESLLKADVARFDIKKPVLEKAVRAENLTSEFIAVKNLRELVSKQKKAFDEVKTKVSHCSERVKNARQNLQEKEKLLRNAEGIYNSKHAIAQKASELGQQAAQYKSLAEKGRNLLTDESEKLKNASSALTSFKESLALEKNKQQQLVKKISDCGGDEKLKNELFDYQNKIEAFDSYSFEKEEVAKAQKSYQRELEKARLDTQENESLLAALKKEELVLQGDIAAKNRHISKGLGNLTEDTLIQDLQVYDKKLEGLSSLEVLNEELIDHFERLNAEKETLNKNTYESKVASVILNGSIQTYKDKQAIVADSETILLFQQKVKILEPQRKELENGKPCPLCGAIHHPYASSIPFSFNAEEKLKEAKEEARKAALSLAEAQNKYDTLSKAIENSGLLIQQLNSSVEDLKSRILGLSSQLELNGLKEKKPITWTQIIKQKKTFIANKREDLSSKIEQIQTFKQAGSELLIKLGKVQASIKELTERTEKRKMDIIDISNLLQQTNVRESLLTSKQEELYKELERFYLRFGIKVSSIASIKQQFVILVKRRETYVDSTNDLQIVEAKIEEISLSQQECLNEINALKNKISAIETEIARHDSEEKKLLKEKQDLLGSSTSQEFEASAREELEQVQLAYREAEELFNQRADEFQSEESNGLTTEKVYQDLVETIEKKQAEFETKLKEAGFVSEAQFTASKITAQQKEELQKQSDDLTVRSQDLYGRKEALTQEIDSLSAQNLTSQSLSKLRESLEKNEAELQVSLLRESEISEEIEHNLYTKQRYERESQEQRKRENESLRWEDFSLLLASPANNRNRSFLYPIAFDILLDFSNKQLAFLNPRYSLSIDRSDPLKLLLVDEYKREQPVSFEKMTSEETYLVSLSLSLGFTQMIGQLRNADLVFIGKSAISSDVRNQQYLLAAVSKLNQQGKMVGMFSEDFALNTAEPLSIEFYLNSIHQIKGAGIRTNLT